VLERWQASEDRHYAIPALRWGSTFLASRGEGALARACASALAHIAAAAPHGEALSAVALGECALLDGDADQAVRHFAHALDLLQQLEHPYERASTQLRLGQVLATTGDRQAAVQRLVEAYRTARKLHRGVARPTPAVVADPLRGSTRGFPP
jgi:tetratricopeptide (TPR) repeat protein